MRLAGFLILCCLTMQSAFADVTNLMLTVDGITYSNVTFGTLTPGSVSVRHNTGVASIPLAKLPPDLQKQFGYDPAAAEQWFKAKRAYKESERRQALLKHYANQKLPDTLTLGAIGVPNEVQVLQVLGPEEMLVRTRWFASSRYAPTPSGSIYVVPAESGWNDPFIIREVSTQGYTDDSKIAITQVLKVAGTTTYKTAAGAHRTVFVVKPYTGN